MGNATRKRPRCKLPPTPYLGGISGGGPGLSFLNPYAVNFFFPVLVATLLFGEGNGGRVSPIETWTHQKTPTTTKRLAAGVSDFHKFSGSSILPTTPAPGYRVSAGMSSCFCFLLNGCLSTPKNITFIWPLMAIACLLGLVFAAYGKLFSAGTLNFFVFFLNRCLSTPNDAPFLWLLLAVISAPWCGRSARAPLVFPCLGPRRCARSPWIPPRSASPSPIRLRSLLHPLSPSHLHSGYRAPLRPWSRRR